MKMQRATLPEEARHPAALLRYPARVSSTYPSQRGHGGANNCTDARKAVATRIIRRLVRSCHMGATKQATAVGSGPLPGVSGSNAEKASANRNTKVLPI
eukprot:CAMPEP_0115099992 /NCGR_PEP_ID=MMETSP0227-20121206/32239_1 /TAXON_ID=89957 /ORGANISM="Polarella glacialis, Strain CCMP 1383" /LENGTH=98 /DNA_ID=CAMNT_0002495203 /DNA_START=596 /DNA_END=892 /DNA_ORIENTATION=-